MVLRRELNAYCFFMNGMVGVSLLIIPAAVQQAGFVGSLLVLLFLACANWLTHLELLEITERLSLSLSITDPLMKEDALLKSPYQWDLPRIVYMKLGGVCGVIYSLFFAAHAFGGMAAYASVFGKSLGTLMSCKYECYEDYWLELKQAGCESKDMTECLPVYRLGTVAFFFISFAFYKRGIRSEWIHLLMTSFQIVTVLCIVLYAFTQGSVRDFPQNRELLWRVGNLPYVTSVFIFAGIYQVYAPSVLAASTKHPDSQKKVAEWIFWSTLVMYGSMGLVTVLFFKAETNPLDIDFSKSDSSFGLLLLMVELGMFVFADSISNSAFFRHTLADAIFSFVYSPNIVLEKANHPYMHKWLPILCGVPAFTVAYLYPNIVSSIQETVMSLCGLCGVVLTLVFIPLCHNKARKQTGDDRLNLEMRLPGLEWLNYGVAGIAAAGFVFLFLHKAYSTLPDTTIVP